MKPWKEKDTEKENVVEKDKDGEEGVDGEEGSGEPEPKHGLKARRKEDTAARYINHNVS